MFRNFVFKGKGKSSSSHATIRRRRLAIVSSNRHEEHKANDYQDTVSLLQAQQADDPLVSVDDDPQDTESRFLYESPTGPKTITKQDDYENDTTTINMDDTVTTAITGGPNTDLETTDTFVSSTLLGAFVSNDDDDEDDKDEGMDSTCILKSSLSSSTKAYDFDSILETTNEKHCQPMTNIPKILKVPSPRHSIHRDQDLSTNLLKSKRQKSQPTVTPLVFRQKINVRSFQRDRFDYCGQQLQHLLSMEDDGSTTSSSSSLSTLELLSLDMTPPLTDDDEINHDFTTLDVPDTAVVFTEWRPAQIADDTNTPQQPPQTPKATKLLQAQVKLPCSQLSDDTLRISSGSRKRRSMDQESSPSHGATTAKLRRRGILFRTPRKHKKEQCVTFASSLSSTTTNSESFIGRLKASLSVVRTSVGVHEDPVVVYDAKHKPLTDSTPPVVVSPSNNPTDSQRPLEINDTPNLVGETSFHVQEDCNTEASIKDTNIPSSRKTPAWSRKVFQRLNSPKTKHHYHYSDPKDSFLQRQQQQQLRVMETEERQKRLDRRLAHKVPQKLTQHPQFVL